jgi:hypothetical protein
VLAVHLLTENSIEERVWETIRLKKALFQSLFDGAGSEVSFEKLGRRSIIETLKEIVPDAAAATAPEREKKSGKPSGTISRESVAQPELEKPDGLGHALGLLFEAGMKFLESLAPAERGASGEGFAESPGGHAPGERPRNQNPGIGQLVGNVEAAIAPLVKKDPADGKSALHIPLPASLSVERIAGTITAALSRLLSGK